MFKIGGLTYTKDDFPPKIKLLLIFIIHNCMNNYPVPMLFLKLLFNVKNKSFSCFIYTRPKLKQLSLSSSHFKKHLISLPLPDNPLHFKNIKANISHCLYRPFMHTKSHQSILYIRADRVCKFVINHSTLLHFLIIYPLTR